jgi:N6-adenosine-specific RNA methylase IME4
MNINRQFKALIRPLSSDEYEQLEQNLLDEGCRDPLVVWGDTLLDGHNRYEICTKHGIDYRTVQAPVYIRTDEDAEDWIDKNQLGRRNLTREEFTLIVGRRYNRRKKGDGERGPKKLDQNEPASTAEIIAAEHGISPATVKRAGKFAEAVDTVKETEPEVVARGEAEILKRAREIQGEKREAKRQEIISKLEDIQTKQAKAIEGVYDVIVIDPPWPMQKIERDVRPNQSEFDYPTMQESELAEMKIPAADDCHMWLWTTHKFLPMAFRLLDAWSFKYVCAFVWHKPGGFQPIGLPQYNCEFALYARRGSPQFIDTKALPVCFEAPRGNHSEKPEEFYSVVRRVTAGRRLDMFNRRNVDGFDVWGQEAAS